ncbi:MAG: hypothetical protein GX375_03190 [Clostridiales bacterium]|nr:hypothetical protein [Clostridiales bacterium]
MDDLIYHDINYILQEDKGIKWYFYLSDNKKIMYTNNRQGDWSTLESINSQPIKDFSATIDSLGVIRIVAYTTTRQLLYFEMIDGKWNNQVIERIYSRFQDIPYFFILASSSGVHILYYINHSLSRSGETLIHYYLYEGKWHGGRLWKFMSDQMTSFQSFFLDDKDRLHILFTQRWRQRFHLYHCRYDSLAFSWIEPTAIHSSSARHNYELHVDSTGNLHILWSRPMESQYQIRYLSKLSRGDDKYWKESIIHESSHKIKTPLIVEDHDLHCFWKEDKALYKMSSKDLGLSWSAPELLRESLDYDAVLLNITSWNKGRPKPIKMWGQEFPHISLAGIDLDSAGLQKPISKVSPIQLSAEDEIEEKEYVNWVDTKESIRSMKRENKRMREAINNLFSQIDHLNSIIFSLQDQMQLNERSLFNINAQIKQLSFQVKQLQLRSRQTKSKIYGIEQYVEAEQQEEKLDQLNEKQSPPEEEVQNISDVQNLDEHATIEEVQSLNEGQEGSHEINQNYEEDETEKEAQDLEEDREGISEEEAENKDTHRISLGNTTILINPENPENL